MNAGTQSAELMQKMSLDWHYFFPILAVIGFIFLVIAYILANKKRRTSVKQFTQLNKLTPSNCTKEFL
jgi:hypothetical protein